MLGIFHCPLGGPHVHCSGGTATSTAILQQLESQILSKVFLTERTFGSCDTTKLLWIWRIKRQADTPKGMGRVRGKASSPTWVWPLCQGWERPPKSLLASVPHHTTAPLLLIPAPESPPSSSFWARSRRGLWGWHHVASFVPVLVAASLFWKGNKDCNFTHMLSACVTVTETPKSFLIFSKLKFLQFWLFS